MSTLTQQRGAEFTWTLTITQNGLPVNLSGATINFAMRTSYPAGTVVSDADAVIYKSTSNSKITIYDAPNGIAKMPMLYADTKALEFDPPATSRAYVWAVEVWPLGATGPLDVDDGGGAYIITADVVRA